jgi:hypothetical protein
MASHYSHDLPSCCLMGDRSALQNLQIHSQLVLWSLTIPASGPLKKSSITAMRLPRLKPITKGSVGIFPDGGGAFYFTDEGNADRQNWYPFLGRRAGRYAQSLFERIRARRAVIPTILSAHMKGLFLSSVTGTEVNWQAVAVLCLVGGLAERLIPNLLRGTADKMKSPVGTPV